MWDVKACRSCLHTDGKLERMGAVVKRLYTSITGLEIKDCDGYPSYLCAECYSQIKKALAFRRKSRRAFFVFKEIMNFRKQVTLSEIIAVDRIKTNLISPYNYWDPQNVGFFSINNTKDNTNNVDYDFDIDIPQHAANTAEFILNITPKAESIMKYTPETTNSVCIVTDIQPDNNMDVDALKDETEIIKDEHTQLDNVDNNAETLDNVEIDPEDIFKDLPEENSEESEEEVEVAEEIETNVEKLVKITLGKEGRMKIRQMYEEVYFIPSYSEKCVPGALTSATVRVLSHEEQVEAFQKRLESVEFREAILKCAVCVKTFMTLKDLKNHVFVHNLNVKFEHVCKICQSKYDSEHLLQIHNAEIHQYEYTCHCRKNNNKYYTLRELVLCYKNHKSSKRTEDKRLKNFVVKPLRPHQYKLTLKSRSDVKTNHTCATCGFKFRLRGAYNAHWLSHFKPNDGNSKFKCDICNTWHLQLNLLKKHMLATHLFSYKCKICKHMFYNRDEAQDHKRKHQNVCEICFKCYKSRTALITHAAENHPTTMHCCNLCGESYRTQGTYYRHQLLDHGYISVNDPMIGDPALCCAECNIQFVTEQAYVNHVVKQGHEAADDIPLACRPCKKLFSTQKDFDAHKPICKKCTAQTPDFCPYCGVRVNSHTYRIHILKSHQDVGEVDEDTHVLCELCGESVPMTEKYKHKKRHTKEQSTYYQCCFCSAITNTSKGYVSHMLFNHTYKPYVCAICPMRFKYRTECREHILKVHAPGLFYTCKFCDRKFSHLDYLNEHSMRAHRVNLKKTCKELFLTKRMKGSIYVYPDMKIDGSLIDIGILEQITVELCDYMEETNNPVDYRDYFIFDANVEPILSNNVQKRKVKRTEDNIQQNEGTAETGQQLEETKPKEKVKVPVVKIKKKKNVNKIEKSKNEIVEQLKPNESVEEANDSRQQNKETDQQFKKIHSNVKIEVISNIPIVPKEIENKIEETKTVVTEEILSNKSIEESNECEDNNEVTEEIMETEESYENYQVIEQDGEEYVLINGILYKIEADV